MGLKEAAEKFIAEIEDLSCIEVTTYTGKVEGVVSADNGEIDWEKVGPTSEHVVLVAATRIKADQDTVNFYAQGVGIDDMEDLVRVHQGAIESAQSGRLAIIKLVQGLLKLA